MAQFCTHELKIIPITEHLLKLRDTTGRQIWSWQGVPIEESAARRNKLQGCGACGRGYEEMGGGIHHYRPILRWPWQAVFEAHRAKAIEPNPLYSQGRTRVGCLCVNSGKDEILTWSRRDVAHIERINEWEDNVSEVSKRSNATFFPTPGDNDTARERGGIWQKVQWTRIARGGRQFSLLTDLSEPTSCSSEYGLRRIEISMTESGAAWAETKARRQRCVNPDHVRDRLTKRKDFPRTFQFVGVRRWKSDERWTTGSNPGAKRQTAGEDGNHGLFRRPYAGRLFHTAIAIPKSVPKMPNQNMAPSRRRFFASNIAPRTNKKPLGVKYQASE